MAMNIILEQDRLANRIVNSFNNFISSPEQSVSACKVRMQALENTFARFETNHYNILTCRDYPIVKDHVYFTQNVFEKTEERTLQLLGKFQGILDQAPMNNVNNNQAPRVVTIDNDKLPPLNLPDFDGDFRKWESFGDIFTSSVINRPNTSDVVKLRHLKGHVKGDALDLIQPFDITEHNFVLAWNRLKEKFEVKKRLVNAHISAIYSLKPMAKNSANEIKKILSGINTPLAALKALDRTVQYWDDLLVFHILSLLDIKTREQWEVYLSNSFNNVTLSNSNTETVGETVNALAPTDSDPPTLAKLLEFLDKQALILESIEETSMGLKQNLDVKVKNQNVSTIPATSHHTKIEPSASRSNQSVVFKCIICNESHLFQFCPKFKSKNLDQRKEFLSF